MKTISVVIITLNEARNIKRCLDSVQEIADEIIVLDSFSTDETEKICRQYKNLKFYQQEWKGYSAAKNDANSFATCDYILSLDADEEVSEKLKNSILKIKKLKKKQCYSFNRLSNYCGKWIYHSGWYPDRKIRIFPKNCATWIGDFVHETLSIDPSLENVVLEGDLFHYSYKNLEEHYQKTEKYAELHAQEMKIKGKKSNFIKQWFSPLIRFMRMYFLQMGFLDGKAGFRISYISAYGVWLKYEKLRKKLKII